MGRLPDIEQHYAGELIRKGIHLCSLSIPVAYYHLGTSTTLTILLPLTAAFLLTDAARLLIPSAGALYGRLFGWLLRSHEKDGVQKRLNGATYVLLSACICILLFPMVITVTAFSVLIISDTFAALVGRRIGRRPFFRKSLEGSFAFFITAVIVVLLTPKVAYLRTEYFIGFLASAVGTVTEAVESGVDDNLSIPLVIGATMWGLYALLLPEVNASALDF
jgi:dolichol kinase